MIISDHALIRWLERRYGVDLQPYRDELRELVEPFAAVNAIDPCIAEGCYAVIKGNTVTTILPSKPSTQAARDSRTYVPSSIDKYHWKALKRKRPHK